MQTKLSCWTKSYQLSTIKITTMFELVILFLIGLITPTVTAIVFYKAYSREKQIQHLMFNTSFLVTGDGAKINYKDIQSITLRSMFFSEEGWSPRVVIAYTDNNGSPQMKVLVPNFRSSGWFYGGRSLGNYTTTENLREMLKYIPEKVDYKCKEYLNGNDIKFEELEPMKQFGESLRPKPSGSFRILE